MDKEMSRGDTMLISIDAPTEYPVTTLQDVRMSIKQGRRQRGGNFPKLSATSSAIWLALLNGL